jgi:hypothetical protein
MVLVHLENMRCSKKRDIAWNTDDILKAKGKELREMAFKDINVNNYIINVFIPDEVFIMCKVKENCP